MASEVVHTQTRDKVISDQVYESPVDQYEVRFRRIVGYLAAAVFLLLLIALLV